MYRKEKWGQYDKGVIRWYRLSRCLRLLEKEQKSKLRGRKRKGRLCKLHRKTFSCRFYKTIF